MATSTSDRTSETIGTRPPAVGKWTHAGASLELQPPRGLKILAQRGLRIGWRSIPGLVLDLASGQSVNARWQDAAAILDLESIETVGKAIKVSLPDGAAMEMLADAKPRIDVLRDGGYSVAGGLGIKITSAEGESWLPQTTGPAAGGPLLTVSGPAESPARLQRLNPVVEVKLTGVMGTAPIQIGWAKEIRPLEPGGVERVGFANGASLVLERPVGRKALLWRVEKGLFRLVVGGFEACRTLAAAGQNGEFVFDDARSALDISHVTSDSGTELFVELPSQTLARLQPKASLQFAAGGQNAFIVGAAGTGVKLTGLGFKPMDLTGSTEVFRDGKPSRTPASAGAEARASAFRDVVVSWNRGGEGGAVVSSTLGEARVQSGGEQRIGTAGSGVLAVAATREQVKLTAVEGGFAVRTGVMPGLAIEVLEGDAAVFSFQPAFKILVIKAEQANSSPLRVVFTDGLTPAMDPGSSLTLLLGTNPRLLDMGEGGLVFFEAAGAGGAQSLGVAPAASVQTRPELVGPITALDTGRLPQPPASTEQ